MRRGELWYIKPLGMGTVRPALIISNDLANTMLDPTVLDVTDVPPAGGASYAVALTDDDPIPHTWVAVNRIGKLRKDAFMESVGMLTADTMNAVSDALADYLDLT